MPDPTPSPQAQLPLTPAPAAPPTQAAPQAPAAAPAAPPAAAPPESAKPAAPGNTVLTQDPAPELKLPEGVTWDDSIKADFSKTVGDLKLKGEDAQRFLDLGVKLAQSQAKAATEAFEKAKADWAAQLPKDKEVGGEKYAQNVEFARHVVRQFGDADLRQLFEQTGMGNHPAMFRFIAKVGSFMRAKLGEDSSARVDANGQGGSGTSKNERLARFYDSPDMQRLFK